TAATKANYTSDRMVILFPFEFRICCGRIAAVVLIEQFPTHPLGLCRTLGHFSDRLATLDRAAHVLCQSRKIPALFRNSRRPARYRTVAGHDPPRWDFGHLVDRRNPAPQPAAPNRHVP